jgi:phage major head subunit gpT-like protein
MVQTSTNFTQLSDLDPVLSEIFFQQYEALPAYRALMFGLRESDKAKETDLRIGSLGDPLAFDGTVVYDSADADYSIEYTHVEYTRGFQVERKLLDDAQYSGIFDQAAALGVAFGRKQEKDAASVFNNAFDVASPGYDGLPLCSASHPRSQTDSTTVSNTRSDVLSVAALDAAINQLMSLGDDLGDPVTALPTILLVPQALRRTALELTESAFTPEDDSNAINPNTNLTTVVWPYLTSSTAWFVLDGVMAKRVLKWYDRIAPEFAAEDSFDTLIRKYRGYARWSFGWSDWRFVVGSTGAGS